MTVKKHSTNPIDLKALVAEDCDWMKSLIKAAVQEVLEAEMTELLGAGPHERQEGRQGYRAGYYERGLVTRVGKLELRVPRDVTASFGPPSLSATRARRRRSWPPWRRCPCKASPHGR